MFSNNNKNDYDIVMSQQEQDQRQVRGILYYSYRSIMNKFFYEQRSIGNYFIIIYVAFNKPTISFAIILSIRIVITDPRLSQDGSLITSTGAVESSTTYPCTVVYYYCIIIHARQTIFRCDSCEVKAPHPYATPSDGCATSASTAMESYFRNQFPIYYILLVILL